MGIAKPSDPHGMASPPEWPEIVEDTLRAELLPKGGYLASDQLDVAFTTTKLRSKVFLAADIPVVVISAIGE
ncbi:hypothetical protein [Mycolicibacterium brisbanense]|uniref:Uncharacterized protein n=1 Tax=Mycolicibacterium brisbanense TaxID=146020 RepID=A0A100W6Z6_9MYCO|nr:hypothetical protein [Mycolicibacterium brisbanense]MCV7162162.1 hypothetical protein [Mycolicibacterium brisbanense]GAS92783.1 uncharacterized protein RMCB_6879 [Mycolicibacterium brisbanense]